MNNQISLEYFLVRLEKEVYNNICNLNNIGKLKINKLLNIDYSQLIKLANYKYYNEDELIEFIKFMVIKGIYDDLGIDNNPIISPPNNIDHLWHNVILMVKFYQEFCLSLYGSICNHDVFGIYDSNENKLIRLRKYHECYNSIFSYYSEDEDEKENDDFINNLYIKYISGKTLEIHNIVNIKGILSKLSIIEILSKEHFILIHNNKKIYWYDYETNTETDIYTLLTELGIKNYDTIHIYLSLSGC